MEWITVIFIGFVVVVVWLAIREIVTWYFKIDTIVRLMNEQITELRCIRDLLSDLKKSQNQKIIEPGQKIEL